MPDIPTATLAILIVAFWAGCVLVLWVWQRPLLTRTWREPALADTCVLIESDDWGPGGEFHGQRLNELANLLSRHHDHCGRPAVLTADMVLSVPDTRAIRDGGFGSLVRNPLDRGFPGILSALRDAMAQQVLVPQLHGIEHLHGAGLVALGASGDPRVSAAFDNSEWWDWETLDSPLQGHYVDGSRLPTTPLPAGEQRQLVDEATGLFRQLFGFMSTSTVAPCYLWGEDTESAWASAGIRYIQTAGYRCTGRDGDGRYIQDPPMIRVGDINGRGQVYLVRNAMYEPVDGRGADACIGECRAAWRQALPVVISTHRYNYTRDEDAHRQSLAGLDRVLTAVAALPGRLRYLSSPELGAWLADGTAPVTPGSEKSWPPLRAARGLTRLRGFLFRLWYRHPKLRIAAIATGLLLPATLLIAIERLRGNP